MGKGKKCMMGVGAVLGTVLLIAACSSKETDSVKNNKAVASAVQAVALTFPDGKCAFDCEWWCGPNEGEEVEGTCEGNQHCCMPDDAMPKTQCAHTCIKEWETCDGTIVPESEGSCSDIQGKCCDTSATASEPEADVFPDGKCAYNCEWWCGPSEGTEVDGTCAGNQHCCMNEEPAKVQCAHTCIKAWETCNGTVVPESEGSCSDLQGVCCDTGETKDSEVKDAGADTETEDTTTVFPDGSCAYNCEWWCGPNEGVEVDGTCAGNQHCCMNDEPPKVQCAHTCVKEWETCNGTVVPEAEGSCSDLQSVCCDMGEDDTDTGSGTVTFPDGSCAYNCRWWCGPAQGVEVEGTCAGNQHCCMNDQPPKVQCAHTCIKVWETCNGTVVPPAEGSCSDVQSQCCDLGEEDTEETVVFPDGKCAYNCEWWCGPSEGVEVEGTCAGNQHCCQNDEPVKTQCPYTCVKEWEACDGTVVPEAEGSCSDLQSRCCQEKIPPVV